MEKENLPVENKIPTKVQIKKEKKKRNGIIPTIKMMGCFRMMCLYESQDFVLCISSPLFVYLKMGAKSQRKRREKS